MPAPKCGGLANSQGEGVIRYAIGILVTAVFLALPSASAAGDRAPAKQHLRPALAETEAKECPYAHLGLSFYRSRYTSWQLTRGASVVIGRRPRSCADARYLAGLWAKRAYQARRKYERQLEAKIEAKTLRDFVVRDGNHAWHKAVREVQKVYPGTEGWLLSCSWAEGKWGRWVSYGGLYTPEYAKAHYIVGSWMQFKYPTFTGMFRRAKEDTLSRGFLLPRGLNPDIEGWQSPLAVALAAAWARYTGNDGHHWSASFGRGC